MGISTIQRSGLLPHLSSHVRLVLLPRLHLPSLVGLQLVVVDRARQHGLEQRHWVQQRRGIESMADFRLEQLDPVAYAFDHSDFLDRQSVYRHLYWNHHDYRILLDECVEHLVPTNQ